MKRSQMVFLGRLVVSAGLLWVLLAKVSHGAPALPPLSGRTVLWLAGAFTFTLVGVVLSTLRWSAVLHALGQRPRLGRLLSHYFAGEFMSNVLPGTIGGDALRITRLSRDNGQSPTSFASVVLERLSGWLVLPVITLAAFAVNPGLRHLGRASWVAIAVASGTLVLFVVVLLLTARPGSSGLVHHQGWRRFTSAVRMGLRQLGSDPPAAARIIVTGFAYQLVLVVAALMAARALGMPAEVGFTAMLAFLPAVLIAQALPISIKGLGVRETLFVMFLHPLGVPRDQAVALGLLIYLLTLLVSLLGAPAFAVGHRADHRVAPAAPVGR